MSITSTELSELAKELISRENEVAWRSAASRAYYSSFHCARSAAESLPNNAHFALEGGTHKYLIDRFETYKTPGSPEGKQARKVAYMLRDLKKRREKADYDINDVFPKSRYETSVHMSDLTKIEIDKLLSSIPKAA